MIKRLITISKKYLKKSFGSTFHAFLFILGTFWAGVNVIWIVYQFIYMYTRNAPFQEHMFFALFFMIGLPVFTASVYVLIYVKINNIWVESEDLKKHQVEVSEQLRYYINIIEDNFGIIKQNDKSLMHDIDSAKEKNDWEKVIKISKLGARLCLMLADYELRIVFGNEMVKAGNFNSDPISQAIGYIDCLGWSYAKLGEFKEAESYIELGKEYIQNIDSDEANIIRGKYYRHKIGMIYLRNSNNPINVRARKQLKSHRNNYRICCDRVQSKIAKTEMYAYLKRLEGDYSRKTGEKSKAKKNYVDSLKLFNEIHDDERSVKLYYDIGTVEENMQRALQLYLIGYWLSYNISRIDEMHKNLIKIVDTTQTLSNQMQLTENRILLNAIKSKWLLQVVGETQIKSFELNAQYYRNQLASIEQRLSERESV